MHIAGQMEFEFLIPEDARLRVHISQRSNLEYVKNVMDHFDERQREDFCNSFLKHLAEILDIQFSAQLIQKLVFRSAFVTRIRGSFARKFQKAKRRKNKEITYTIYSFSIAMQVWAYEVIQEIRKCFDQRCRTLDAFFKNVQLHVYVALRPTHAYVEQPYFSTLVPYDDPQSRRQDSDDGVYSGGNGEDETSGDDDGDGKSGSDRDGYDSEDTGKSFTPPTALVSSPVRGAMTQPRPVGTSGSSLTRGEVEKLLLDQRILFEM
ncbi:Protein CHROMOSOME TRANSMISSION FIDELITY 7 [Olea europaea subsp. europaea]|uniref:Protein CHROMOSOME TRANSMISSION FIDELITY 7 n=1 Tax=Olea europaea subsp. europaea TaxID=158383 RepID=A0A8S0V096_OLEEU|nr:Protein CHROMOSOME TRANSMISSION FIDELITY 7 [Olea europaea subsp. europaea]